jgi:hypothetical protein
MILCLERQFDVNRYFAYVSLSQEGNLSYHREYSGVPPRSGILDTWAIYKRSLAVMPVPHWSQDQTGREHTPVRYLMLTYGQELIYDVHKMATKASLPEKHEPVPESAKAHIGRVKASVDTDFRVNFIDLFVDHTSRGADINIVPNRFGVFSDYLRDILTPINCPNCESPHVRRSSGRSIREWLLKFAGRKVYYCTNCDWKDIVKVQRWEWEVVLTVALCLLLVTFASIKWALH